MNFEQAKALRLRHWRETLDDHHFRMQNPEGHRAILHDSSARLVEEGLIDLLEKFDMDEMANSAYWLALEELHVNPVMYRSSFRYDIMPRSGGPRLGTIFHSIICLDENRDDRIRPYDGRVYREGETLLASYNYSSSKGRIEGLTLTLEDGTQFDLVEAERMVQGVVYEVIKDPDVYRWMTDVTQVAMENGDFEILRRVRPFLELAMFIQCSVCLDHFGRREDCAHCNGLGFVEKPQFSSKLPEECRGPLNMASELGEQQDVRRR